MRVLLLQAQVWIPSLGGGNKANRLLLEGLARRGHECAAICRATTTRGGPRQEEELVAELAARGAEVEPSAAGSFRFRYRDVAVEAMHFGSAEETRQRILDRARELRPDWIVVSDDKRHDLLAGALEAAPRRVVLLVQTIVQLPFGPLAAEPSPTQTELLKKARGIVVISRFAADYVRSNSSLEPHLLQLPVYGDGPFENLGRPDEGYVTMVNPCVEKGLPIFLALARARRDVPFAAVPTWGADEGVLATLAAEPNVTLLEPADDIEQILARTRVLVAPSLWPETFGYVVVEAMLRGVPVLASDVGGLPEAKLGVDYLLPVEPAVRRGDGWECPAQDVEPWLCALGELLGDAEAYARCSRQSHRAAHDFVAPIGAGSFERLLTRLATSP